MSTIPTTSTPTPASTTFPKIEQANNQGQGSARIGPSTMFQPGQKMEQWPSNTSHPNPGDK